MASQSSAKLLHLLPQQFDLLLQGLEERTPPKTQTLFSMRQLVERLYGFIERSLENHYSFDELAVIIHKGLVDLEGVGAVAEIKGETLRKYFLEVKRERDTDGVKRRSGRGKTDRAGGKKQAGKAVARADSEGGAGLEPEVIQEAIDPLSKPTQEKPAAAKRLPNSRSSKPELAY